MEKENKQLAASIDKTQERQTNRKNYPDVIPVLHYGPSITFMLFKEALSKIQRKSRWRVWKPRQGD
jgi:hypothetical protein